jgi:uncharacterized protein YndB with AHSA1/START domain
MLLTIAIIVAVVIAAILITAATKPDSFRVERTARIKAPPQSIFPHINDLRSHGAWSPFDKDPATKRHFNGAASGNGQVYEWEGDRKVGAGRIEITDAAAPSKVTMKLDMIRPFSANNIVEFTLVPQGEATNVTTDVTWAMHGRQPYMAKLVGTFMNCDKMVGGQFEQGLASLKAIAER